LDWSSLLKKYFSSFSFYHIKNMIDCILIFFKKICYSNSNASTNTSHAMNKHICCFSSFLNKIICLLKMLMYLIFFMILCRNIKVIRDILFFMFYITTASNRDDSFDSMFFIIFDITLENLAITGCYYVRNEYWAYTIDTIKDTLDISHFSTIFLLIIIINFKL